QYVATQWLNRMGGQRLRRHRRPPKFCGHAAGETGRARTTDAVGAVAVVGAHACPAAGSGRLDRRIVARAADRPTAAGAPRPGTGVPTDHLALRGMVLSVGHPRVCRTVLSGSSAPDATRALADVGR